MSSRLHAIATENQAIAADGHYYARGSGSTPVPVEEALEAAVSGTRCHQPDEPLDPPEPPEPRLGEPTRVEVTAEKSLDAARRLCDAGRLHRRAGRVLGVAAHHGVRRLVLGAWGCGVFGNDPSVVARSFRCLLSAKGDGFHQVFDEVVFAVWDRTSEAVNHRPFEVCFESPLG